MKAGTALGHPAGQTPVIVLTMARSGSTLLRFILDSHPELGCPPETSLGSACHLMAWLWDVLAPPGEPAEPGARPDNAVTRLPDAAAASIRRLLDDAYGSYLARHGKRRWCDKSLDNIGTAELLANIYPGAQFICLYRHCMDVIVSAVEACPWGLGGYGFEQYAAGSHGNSVAAVAANWLDRTRAIIEFQEQHADRCHGVRYEDLVSEPEQVAATLFGFLGAEPAPGITQACFAADHEFRGPADHKIWFTAGISRDSLGQGIRVPVAMLPPDLLPQINQALSQLDYREVDDDWSTAGGPVDPRAGHEMAAGDPDGLDAEAEADVALTALSVRLTAAVAWPTADLTATWPDTGRRQLALLAGPARSGLPARGWTLSCGDSGLTISEGVDPASPAITATGATWLAILTGQANMAAELRAGRLRITSQPGGHTRSAYAQVRTLAQLLGLTANPAPARSPGEELALAAR